MICLCKKKPVNNDTTFKDYVFSDLRLNKVYHVKTQLIQLGWINLHIKQ